jgi:hypothetical protein
MPLNKTALPKAEQAQNPACITTPALSQLSPPGFQREQQRFFKRVAPLRFFRKGERSL